MIAVRGVRAAILRASILASMTRLQRLLYAVDRELARASSLLRKR